MDNFVFENCEALHSVTLPNKLTVLPWGTFADCKALQDIVVPEGYTEIEGSVFAGCTSLATVSLPSTITAIGSNAFSETGLTDVYFNASEAEWNNVTISDTGNQPLLDATIRFAEEHTHAYTITDLKNGMVCFSCSCGDSYATPFAEHLNNTGDDILDINSDGIVNGRDYAYLVKQFG